MEGNTCRVILTLTALVVLGLAVYSPATAQQFSEWSDPVNLGPTINSSFADFGSAISKNGLSLYFSSDRPGGFGGNDIWVSQRASVNDPWGLPVNLGPEINTGSGEFLPNFSRDGHLMFFSSNRPGGLGDFDIWVSWRAHTQDDFGWQAPVNLGAGVNSAAFDAAPHYFKNRGRGVPLLFFTSSRPGGLGDLDTYVSAFASEDLDGYIDIHDEKDSNDYRDVERVDKGSFRPAALVFELSSPQRDARPNLRHNGLEIFFYSDRPGSVGSFDLWVATRETTLDAWSTPVNLGDTVNSAFADQHPAVSSNGQTLFFNSNRPDGFGGLDLYMTTRTKLRRR
jgi:WD40-like Beta Propeller Repeat